MNGILLVDKPAGPTSHGAVQRVRRALGVREIGHAGTLDPMATGLLVMGVGEGTKLLAWMGDHDKRYQATIALGVETDTLDAVGRETRREELSAALLEALACGPPAALHERIEAALAGERARSAQIPPAYSAIQQEGVRAHARARRGEEVVLPPREVSVRALDVTTCSADPPTLSVIVEASKGYYVRSLARDLAAGLGTLGHLTALRRVRAGCFDVGEAVSLDVPADALRSRVLPLAPVASRLMPTARLTDAGVVDARHGRVVKPADVSAPGAGVSAWLDAKGELVAIGDVDDEGAGRVRRVFVSA